MIKIMAPRLKSGASVYREKGFRAFGDRRRMGRYAGRKICGGKIYSQDN
jgi:hypothetical protein